MTKDEIKAVVVDELGRIAPDIDAGTANPSGDLREEFDIDSMDFLNLVTALHQRLGVDIPEADYPKLFTLESAVAYLAARA
jgi:acyl carrier protein